MNIGLDIIIPVFNEGENIINVLGSLKKGVKASFRVLICYDFEEDDTLPVVRRFMQDNVIEVEFVKNPSRGPHSAVLSGFRASQAPAVLVFPGDDDYNAPKLDQMLQKMNEGFEIVCASRFITGGSMVGCPWLKSFLVRASAFTLYHLARVPTHDPSNGFRMFSRNILKSIPIESTQGFTYSLEILVKAHRQGFKIAEIPVEWFERTAGQSHFRVGGWLFAYLRWYFYAFGTRLMQLRRRRIINTV
ncbi:MAG: glycosyltransferase family 2 protein [Pseudobdellovibrionaceae bacterium]